MASTPPFQSKLIPYEEEIFDLWYSQRATLKMIQKHLAEKNIIITLAGISSFIRRRRSKTDPHKNVRPDKKAKRKKSSIEQAIEMLDKLSIRSC